MPHPPFNIYSQHRNPDGALAKLRELLPEADVTCDSDGQWTEIKGTWNRGWFKKSLSMKVTHSPEYYSGTGWHAQLMGMTGFFRRFPDSERRPDLFGYIPGLSFVLSFILDPGSIENDPRETVIFEMARMLDGVIFLPHCLLDSQGRAIVSVDGDSDSEAVLPKHDPSGSAVLPQDASESEVAEDRKNEPPTAERVARRLQLMTALVSHASASLNPDEAVIKGREMFVSHIRTQPAWQEAETWEIEAFETSSNDLDEELRWKLPWLSEGAMLLAWALELTELPPYDQQVDVDELYRIAMELSTLEKPPVLRALSEIETFSFQMLAIHWRLRDFYVNRKPMDFLAYSKKAWCGPMDLTLARLAGNDLEVSGVTISECPEEAWRCASGIMEERRKAIHWVLGHDTVYSENDTGT